MGAEECEYKKDHPEINAQIHTMSETLKRLEGGMSDVQKARLTDYKEMIDKLGAVHEKVNAVASATAGLTGKMVVFGLVAAGGGTVLLFIIDKLTKHG